MTVTVEVLSLSPPELTTTGLSYVRAYLRRVLAPGPDEGESDVSALAAPLVLRAAEPAGGSAIQFRKRSRVLSADRQYCYSRARLQ